MSSQIFIYYQIAAVRTEYGFIITLRFWHDYTVMCTVTFSQVDWFYGTTKSSHILMYMLMLFTLRATGTKKQKIVQTNTNSRYQHHNVAQKQYRSTTKGKIITQKWTPKLASG